MEGTVIIICKGGCGKTTENIDNAEFWKGKVEPVEHLLVPMWTCKECVSKGK